MPSIDCRKHNLANQRHHHIYHQLPKVLDDATRAIYIAIGKKKY